MDKRPITGSTAPFFEDVTTAPPGGVTTWTRTSDGVRIRLGFWPGGNRGTVLLFPGRTEYLEKYGPAAQELADRGFATLTIDWRGQGLSDRLIDDRARGHVRRFADYQRDVAALLRLAETADLPRPWFLLAHSMGGCIGLRALHNGLPVRAAAFSAPMWGIRIMAPLVPLAWMLSGASRYIGRSDTYVPGSSANCYVSTEPFAGNVLTTDPEMFDFMARQVRTHPDLALGGPSLNWLHEALREMRILGRMGPPRLPALVSIGSHERVVDVPAIRHIVSRWPGGLLDHVEGARHEIMMETPAIRAAYYDRITAFFDNCRPQG
jgi:lysophospholipase